MRTSRSRAAHRSAGPRSGPHARTSQPTAPSGSGPVWPLRRVLVTSHICHALECSDSGSFPAARTRAALARSAASAASSSATVSRWGRVSSPSAAGASDASASAVSVKLHWPACRHPSLGKVTGSILSAGPRSCSMSALMPASSGGGGVQERGGVPGVLRQPGKDRGEVGGLLAVAQGGDVGAVVEPRSRPGGQDRGPLGRGQDAVTGHGSLRYTRRWRTPARAGHARTPKEGSKKVTGSPAARPQRPSVPTSIATRRPGGAGSASSVPRCRAERLNGRPVAAKNQGDGWRLPRPRQPVSQFER